MAVSYTAVVDVDGEGRNGGQVRSSVAAGWAACFLGALRRAATTRRIRLTSTAITAEITLTHGDDGGFSLSAVLNPVLGGVDQATAQELAEAAHQICPYSKATRDNIPVTVNAGVAA
ncbi:MULTISPECIES: Ohr family peroxiredoxin [Streptomyces]|uniref:Organic hydroperoxide resistance protein n=1 Tax=Streptomyces sviceus (strain ATCC 29083 / DSM 924 / JCM 4929 / NBRC 13980 / NCIMB 11184 / NRRL 5439 / UC 5370) TaxID=463191 RepID=B5I656_STRX2|nr:MULTISPECIES: Ohr family peroxiredoxin [Streptomyces]EDY60561.1 organic hydroperoxide resistance protein [Streptomyces sviceus ATCC 29083]MYT03468.1 Ohr family peroxiredoxin [Streptomyces sp. SID5470]